MVEIRITGDQRETFGRDGFVIVADVLTPAEVDAARVRFEPLFAGEFETGLQPDEWNWRSGTSAEDLSRQICNAWKADETIASIVLRADIGRACAEFRDWPGARIAQDNVIWKPPGAKPLGFHQDDSYQQWVVPSELMTCWITLDDTLAAQGTIEYVRGSHRWPLSSVIEQFHAPDDPLIDMRRAAARTGAEDLELVPIEIPAGSAVFHHGRTWHGSQANAGAEPRRSVVSQCLSSSARFHDTVVSPVYSRYKRHDSTEMDESFYPIMWTKDGYRTAWL